MKIFTMFSIILPEKLNHHGAVHIMPSRPHDQTTLNYKIKVHYWFMNQVPKILCAYDLDSIADVLLPESLRVWPCSSILPLMARLSQGHRQACSKTVPTCQQQLVRVGIATSWQHFSPSWQCATPPQQDQLSLRSSAVCGQLDPAGLKVYNAVDSCCERFHLPANPSADIIWSNLLTVFGENKSTVNTFQVNGCHVWINVDSILQHVPK